MLVINVWLKFQMQIQITLNISAKFSNVSYKNCTSEKKFQKSHAMRSNKIALVLKLP